jgi:hypothetical protein
MNKKIIPAFVLIALAASLLSYKFASAPNAHAQTTTPPEWSVWTTSHNATTAIATRAAVAGITHVADCIIVNAVNAPGKTPTGPIGVKLFDGTNALLVIDLPQPPLTIGGGQVHLCGLNLQGTAGNAMLLEAGGFVGTSPFLSVDLVGHD